jgi:phospholipase/carboxylesterase
MQVERTTWGGLNSVVVHNLPAGQPPKLAVVLCHGFGAPGTDLVGLAQPLLATSQQIGESVAFIFPAATMDLSNRGIRGGRAWWMIDLNRLLYGPPPDFLEQFRRARPEGLVEARQSLVELIEAASQHFQLPADRFVLGGFSQGSMLATDVALRLPTAPAGLAILSGALINEAEWRLLAAKRGPLTVMQSHGRHDSILPFPMALALHEMLLEAGADVDFVAFTGDHEIPHIVIERFASLLSRLLTPGS